MKKQKPAWLKQPIQTNSEKFKNLETKEEILLTPIEATIYKVLKKCEANVIHFSLFNGGEEPTAKVKADNKMLLRCIDWFSKYSIEAYMILID